MATKKTKKKTKTLDNVGSKPTNEKKNSQITDYFPTITSRRLLAKIEAKKNGDDTIRRVLETQIDPCEHLTIKNFANKGRGIVAKTSISKSSFICEYSGDLIDLTEAKLREEEYEDAKAGCYMYYFNWNATVWCVDATKESDRYGRLINHSRKAPNCKTKVFELNNVPHLIFVALRDIKPGEELLYDYGERDPKAIKSNPWLTST